MVTINPEITIGNLLTVGTLLVSVTALLIAWQRDRRLRQKEIATPTRLAAGAVMAKLARWRELSLRFFDKVQPIFTDADVMLVTKQDKAVVRDKLWRDLGANRSSYSERVLDEEIEMSYVDLYGYDQSSRTLVLSAVDQLRVIDQTIFNLLLVMTQRDVINASEPFYSAQLGNALRETSSILQAMNKALMDSVIGPFQKAMVAVVQASDHDLANKNIRLPDPEELFPETGEDRLFPFLKTSFDLDADAVNVLLAYCEPADKGLESDLSGGRMRDILKNMGAKGARSLFGAGRRQKITAPLDELSEVLSRLEEERKPMESFSEQYHESKDRPDS